MNTVFKLGYQAWLLLGLAGIGALAWRREWLVAARLRWTLGPLARPARRRVVRLPARGHVRAQGRLRPRADARRARLAARPRAGRRRRDRLAQRRGGGGGGRARVGRRRLLRVRPRAHLDLHRAADRARVARARAAVGPRRRVRGGRTSRACTSRRRRPAPRPLLRRYGVRYVVVGPLERTDHGDAGRGEVGRARGARGRLRPRTARRSCGRSCEAHPPPHAPWRTYSHSGSPPVGFHVSRRVNQRHQPPGDIAP